MSNFLSKVIIIDDDEMMRSLLTTLLELEKFQVRSISPISIPQVLDEISNFSPDLIVLDVHLGQLNGIEVLQQINSSPAINNIKVIMTSGEDFSIQANQNGASIFLLKPYMPNELIDSLIFLTSQLRNIYEKN